jgi:hypothetical protein
MARLLIVAPLALMTQAMFVAGSAAQSESTRLIFGEGGGSSCGVWRQERHADFLVGTDFDGLMGWVDNYCQSHPLDAVAIAAAKLGSNLGREQRIDAASP